MTKLVVGGRQRGASEKETCLLEEWLGERVLLVETPLPRGGAALQLPHSRSQSEGRALELVASKVHDDGVEPWGGKRKCLRMVYAVTEGPGFPPISLQDELEKLADWRALPNPRKVASRLELLQSPAPRDRAFHQLHPSGFELIDEPLTEEGGGCGFIPEDVLEALLGGGVAARRCTSILVRLVISLGPDQISIGGDRAAGGLFKGMLTRKAGITKVQLSPSMLKVPASRRADLALTLDPPPLPLTSGARLPHRGALLRRDARRAGGPRR